MHTSTSAYYLFTQIKTVDIYIINVTILPPYFSGIIIYTLFFKI